MSNNKLPLTILIVSIFILFYIFYQSEIILDGTARAYYYTHYKFAGILFFISIITFYLNKKQKEYVVIIGLSFMMEWLLIL